MSHYLVSNNKLDIFKTVMNEFSQCESLSIADNDVEGPYIVIFRHYFVHPYAVDTYNFIDPPLDGFTNLTVLSVEGAIQCSVAN